MSDPKYPVVDGKMSHIDGYVLPEDEPTMVFRGKDIGSLMAICEYVEMLEEQPQNPVIVSHRVSSLERLQAFYDYQMQNPDLQSVGCSRRAHEGGGGFLCRARRVLELNESFLEEYRDKV
jgi:hypothetical protein